MSNKSILIIGLAITACVAAFLFWPGNQRTAGNKTKVVMYKNPGCECCTQWADYMADSEFFVEEVATPAMSKIKYDNGITAPLVSCHTAIVEGYVVEGHVPVEDVRRLLAERPDAIGLAVPGMPIGSPGMEMPGHPGERYDVLLVHRDGQTSVYSSH